MHDNGVRGVVGGGKGATPGVQVSQSVSHVGSQSCVCIHADGDACGLSQSVT